MAAAVEMAGLKNKVLEGGRYVFKNLRAKERGRVLGFLGTEVQDYDDPFKSLLRTAKNLADKKKSLEGIVFSRDLKDLPVVDTRGLYVRDTYKELYDEV